MKYLVLIAIALLVVLIARQEVAQAPTDQVEQSSTKSETEADVQSPTPFARGGDVEVYDGIKIDRNLKSLNLAGRNFSGSLKAEIRLLENLQELDISHNEFTGVPAEVGQLSNLKTLNLSYNPITGIPHEIGNLSKLEVLDLRGTQYSEFDLNAIKQSLPESTSILVD